MNIPISLYIHTPWCAKKCPYCDFNSHAISGEIPEGRYQTQLQKEFRQQAAVLQQRALHSIFIGGGTPSLLQANTYRQLFDTIEAISPFKNRLEITLEANPGSVEQQRFSAYREAGINRLSLGVQSFNDNHLNALGRIHNSEMADQAIEVARQAGFDNINLDLMFGLPEQTPAQALDDLTQAIAKQPQHISWYQLTLEPNTLFHHFPPALPDHDTLWQMQQQGQALLAAHGYQQYEVSAYAKAGFVCQHNLNYWQFGDYLGIGAGAHSKLSDWQQQVIWRQQNVKHPRDYLRQDREPLLAKDTVSQPLFDYMLNALRLNHAPTLSHIQQRTFLSDSSIKQQLQPALSQKLIELNGEIVEKTTHGALFLDDLVSSFL